MSQLNEVLHAGIAELNDASTITILEQVKAKYLGKNGQITALMQQLKQLAPEERKQFGIEVNHAKTAFEAKLLERKQAILDLELSEQLSNEQVDVTLDGRGIKLGSLHPVSLSQNRMCAIFQTLGFTIADGPEIESDYYNFTMLNMPNNHPARAMQDTFYTEGKNVLRTHTSPIQVRYAKQNKPPIKVIAPGRVYRVDMDATHSPMFHQLEGLWIEEGISFAHLKGIIIEFLRQFFAKEDLEIRFRASFFPFTEPSAEVDIKSASGNWLEVLGCGMVHPKVLENMGIDSKVYSGFAFGVGIDRFTMLRYQIADLRLLFENDLDFLKQFQGENGV